MISGKIGIALQNDVTSPFGTYSLSGWRENLRQKIPHLFGLNRTLASLVRRISLLGSSTRWSDIESHYHGKVRLDVGDNLTDKHVFCGRKVLSSVERDHFANVSRAAVEENRELNFVDVGANTGLYALEVLKIAKIENADVKLLCVEPNPVIGSRLEANFSFNDYSHVDVAACAVSDLDGEMYLDVPTSNAGEAQLNRHQSGSSVKVQVKRLVEVVKEAGFTKVDILKIDVEGHEVPALSTLLADKRLAPKHIVAEMAHDPNGALDKLFAENSYKLKDRAGANAVFTYESGIEDNGQG